MNTKESVLAAIAQVLRDGGRGETEIRGDLALGAEGLNLDSVDMATVVAALERELGIDPFAAGSPSFRTVDEFVRLYEGSQAQ